jgi:hypothetical protein
MEEKELGEEGEEKEDVQRKKEVSAVGMVTAEEKVDEEWKHWELTPI